MEQDPARHRSRPFVDARQAFCSIHVGPKLFTCRTLMRMFFLYSLWHWHPHASTQSAYHLKLIHHFNHRVIVLDRYLKASEGLRLRPARYVCIYGETTRPCKAALFTISKFSSSVISSWPLSSGSHAQRWATRFANLGGPLPLSTSGCQD